MAEVQLQGETDAGDSGEGVYVETPIPELNTFDSVAGSIDMLNQIVATVRDKGICTADVEAVQQIIDDVKEAIPEIEVNVSLETFSGVCTANRSLMNQKASVESFVGTVKKIIAQLIDIAIKLFKDGSAWLKTVAKNIDTTKDRTESIWYKVLEIRKMYKFLDAPYQFQNLPQVAEVAKSVLEDPKLPRNKLQLSFFYHPELHKEFLRYTTLTYGNCGTMEAKLRRTLELAETGVVDTTAYDNLEVTTRDLIERLQEFVEISPDPKFFMEPATYEFWKRIPDIRPSFETESLAKASEAYAKCSKHMTAFRAIKFEYESDVNDVKDMVTKFTRMMGMLDTAIDMMAQSEVARLRFVACQYNFYVKMISLSNKAIIENVNLSPDVRKEQLEHLKRLEAAAK